MRVYISGPITGQPIDVARKTFADAAADLTALGYEAVNPCELPTDPDCTCPNTAGVTGTGSGHQWACYLRKDIRAIADCQAILMLPGWETSHGARFELHVASTIGLDVWWQTPPHSQDEHTRLQQLENVLAEILNGAWEQGHPGYPALRTYWCRADKVATWRAVLNPSRNSTS